MKDAIQAVEVSYFVHATEDLPRIDEKVTTALGIHGERVEENLEGYFGNRIICVRYHLLGEAASLVVASLATNLPAAVKRELRTSLDKNIDEHSSFYLRLDKQQLMAGRYAMGSSDPIRLKIKPRLFTIKGGANEFYRTVVKLDG